MLIVINVAQKPLMNTLCSGCKQANIHTVISDIHVSLADDLVSTSLYLIIAWWYQISHLIRRRKRAMLLKGFLKSLWKESIDSRYILHKNGQLCGKRFYVMAPSWPGGQEPLLLQVGSYRDSSSCSRREFNAVNTYPRRSLTFQRVGKSRRWYEPGFSFINRVCLYQYWL